MKAALIYMAEIPQPNITIASLIDAAHEDRQERPRPHLGASLLGHYCDRYLWLSFRWAVIEHFPGRILRLFRRGQNEERTIISDLRAIGVDVKTTNGYQDRVDFGNHVSGSMDGIANSGVLGAEKTPHVLEFKTHSKKSFDDLEKNGVEKSKPQHWAQCQVYMLGSKLDRALYVAVCKDDDRIYTERLRLDKDAAIKLVERGHRIVDDNRLPPPISTDPTWYQCRMCGFREFCHVTKTTKETNCRTCAHSTPMADSTWYCERHADTVPTDFQYQGCDSHVLHPDLVPWELRETDSEWEAIYIIDGKEVRNGENGYRSSEIVANPTMCAMDDPNVQALRERFDARIVG